ncbi:hypothetical protein XH98_16120 [Bradyrhizobium sp. CCBAU 51745]|nr:hypothetical protein [Bradyrhizobium sp. CCBAU 51745]
MMHTLSNGLTGLRENVTTRESGETNPLVDPKGLLEQAWPGMMIEVDVIPATAKKVFARMQPD